MQWLDTSLIEPVWQKASNAAPTNPSSLTLALIGAGILLLFGARIRSRQQTQRTEATEQSTSIKKRRAA